MKETMTVHEALAELKTLDSRIAKAIADVTFVVANRHSNTKIMGMSIPDFSESVKDAYKSIMSLINRRDAIKQAVAVSNAVAKVTIADKTYTVAQAIEMKNHGMTNLKTLQSVMESQLSRARREADRMNESVPDKADSYMSSVYSVSDQKNMSEELKKTREDFIASQTYELVDPLKTVDIIKELESKTSAFYTKVDSALSVSNALTTIEVEYETL